MSAEAISKAISDGRIRDAVVRVNDVPKIADPDLADRELDANSRPRIDRASDRSGDKVAPHEVAEYYESRALREATRAQFDVIRLAEKRGELVNAKEMESRLVSVFTQCRTRLLSIPTRARQRDSSLSSMQVDLFDTLIREALEVLAAMEPDEPAE
ncbi:MAG: hypothetical protein H0U59_02510 [Gemmatimonadaceae bacterium]|nr:hypothetical protein [Gemmatimonadaceae bacterium]